MHPDIQTISGIISGKSNGVYSVSIGGGFPFLNVPSVHPCSQYFEGQGVIIAFLNPDSPVIISPGYRATKFRQISKKIIGTWPQYKQNPHRDAKSPGEPDIIGEKVFTVNEYIEDGWQKMLGLYSPIVLNINGEELIFAVNYFPGGIG